MMISAEYPKHSVNVIVNSLDNAIDHDVVPYDDSELVRGFMTALNILSKSGAVVICKAEDYQRMSDNEDLLDSLKGAGVDNWEGYDDALEDYWNNKEED